MNERPRSVVRATDRAALGIQGVSFRYGGTGNARRTSSPPWVVSGVDVTVRQAEILGVIGPNGSGKSSLLKLMAGLIEPQQGSVSLFGEGLRSLPRESVARRIAYMPQDLSFDFPVSVVETVLMGRYPHRRRSIWNMVGWEQREDLAVAEEAMVATDVISLADRLLGTISAGERQRVLLARALAQQPRVLLLDEPTAHLDLNHQLEVCRVLARIHEQLQMTVVFVSHDINLAAQYCDRMMVMKAGRMVAIGAPHEVIQTRLLAEVYGCEVLVDQHPESGAPRVSLPGQYRLAASSRA